MEDHGNPIAVGHAELLRRFFFKVYMKLTAECLEEAGERPPRGGTHGGDDYESVITNNVEYGVQGDLVTVGEGFEETKAASRDSNDIYQADVSACLKHKILSPVIKLMGHITSSGTLHQHRLDESKEVAMEDGEGCCSGRPQRGRGIFFLSAVFWCCDHSF